MVPSRVRGQVAAWSVLPVAVVVIVIGSLFWASVWIAVHSPPRTVEVTSEDQVEVDEQEAAEWDEARRAVAEAAYGPALADEEAEDAPSSEYDEVTDDQGEAVAELAGPIEELDEIAIVAAGHAAERVAATGPRGPTATNEDVTTRAEELTARAEALTARNEELVIKLDGLTTKIEELEAKLEASGAVLAALPAVAPSPVALPRQSDPVTVRASQTQQTPPGRSPWVVSPLPEPGSRVAAGPIVIETRARGEAPIKEIRLQLDGVAVPVALERQNETTWRGRGSVRVGPGSHTVAVFVVDAQGRIGSYRWKFDATPS